MKPLSKKIKLILPNGEKKILLHSCCAPCSGSIMEMMADAKIDFTIFFYNPNIHPRNEYELRKEENIRFAKKIGIPFVDADYEVDDWFKHVKGLEWAAERGERCSRCFDFRFERTALYAHENGFKVFTSSMGISRWKDLDQVHESGVKAAKFFSDVIYWDCNWRKQGGSQRMYEIATEEEFYKQGYCGCIYSLRDTNQWRSKHGKKKIIKGLDHTHPKFLR